MTDIIEVQTEKKERTKRSLKPPGRFIVMFHNDNSTPMEFVTQVLESIFHHEHTKATELTLEIHTNGKAAAGIYSLEIAEQKASETVALARNNGFPLSLTIEPE